jgi:hypothetical protein
MSIFYMGHLPIKIKFNINIGCVMSLKWSHVRYNVAKLLFIIECPQYKLVCFYNHMLPPNLPTSRTKIKHVIALWRALLIMEDVGCSLTFVKVTNSNIIKAMAKFTH